MAVTGIRLRRGGWQLQAERLTATHTTAGVAATALTGWARRGPSLEQPAGPADAEIELANKLQGEKRSEPRAAVKRAEPIIEFPAERVVRLEQKVSRKPAASRNMNATAKALVAVPEKPFDASAGKPVPAHESLVVRVIELAKELEREKLAEPRELPTPVEAAVSISADRTARLEQEFSQKAAASQNLNAHAETVIAAPEKPFDAPEENLTRVHEELIVSDIENRSLQASLDLMKAENARLSGCLIERNATIEGALVQLESMKSALKWLVRENAQLCRRVEDGDVACDTLRSRLEAMQLSLTVTKDERDKLAALADDAKARLESETGTLTNRLEAMSSRLHTMERMLAKTLQSLLERDEQNLIAERKIADATCAAVAAKEELESLRNLLSTKERQLEKLEDLHANLLRDTDLSLRTLRTRENAMVRAERRIKHLRKRLFQLEAKANRARHPEKMNEVGRQLPSEPATQPVCEAPKTIHVNPVEPPPETAHAVSENHTRPPGEFLNNRADETRQRFGVSCDNSGEAHEIVDVSCQNFGQLKEVRTRSVVALADTFTL